MDGTILDSIAVTERIWKKWADGAGIDVRKILSVSHGRRGEDVLRDLAFPGIDPKAASDWLTDQEKHDTEGIVPVAGAGRLLNALPAERWGLVTSADASLATLRTGAAGLPLPQPDRFVTAELVANGKPDPEGYRLGAARLGFAPPDVLVFEDAHSGLDAAHAAGCRVVAITTTFPPEKLGDEEWLPDLAGLSYEGTDDDGRLILRVIA